MGSLFSVVWRGISEYLSQNLSSFKDWPSVVETWMIQHEKELLNWAHAYNPSYLRGGEQDDHSSRPTQAKHFSETPSQHKKMGMVV
jgi:hypothetical protein